MRIEIRSDKVIIDGYVNAVERQSRPVLTPYGKAIEVMVEFIPKDAIKSKVEAHIQ